MESYKEPDDYEKIASFESYVKSSLDNVSAQIRDATDKHLSDRLQVYDPSWVMPMGHSGEIVIKEDSEYRFEHPGKTAQKIIVKSKQWQHAQISEDVGFIIGVVNCNTRDIQNRIVSEETRRGANSDDLEVFDSIHELERIYNQTKFGLGIIKIDSDLQVEEDNHLEKLVLEHLEKQRNEKDELSSMSLFIVAESYNISKDDKNSINDVFGCIPFKKLKENGIDKIKINLISCNTSEVAAELMIATEKTAKENGLALEICFQDGYIFNNISYRYLPADIYEQVRSSLLENSAQNLQQQYTLTEEPTTKNSRLMQIISPGFSNILAPNLDDLKEFVQEKKVPTNGQGSEVKKKLIKPGIREIESGKSFKYIADNREIEIKKHSEESHDRQETPKGSPRNIDANVKKMVKTTSGKSWE